jgi:hypothetical protein
LSGFDGCKQNKLRNWSYRYTTLQCGRSSIDSGVTAQAAENKVIRIDSKK